MRQGGGRAKGAGYELKIARRLCQWWNQPDAKTLPAKDLWMRRTPQSGGWSRAVTAGDIVVVSEEAKDFPWCPEMKKQEIWTWSSWVKDNPGCAFYAYWGQCCTAAKDMQKLPLLIFSQNNEEDYFGIYPCLAKSLGVRHVMASDEKHDLAFGLLDDLLAVPKDKVLACTASLLALAKQEIPDARSTT